MLANRRQDACAPAVITFQVAGYLTEFTGGRAEIKVAGSPATVGEALSDLWMKHVGLRDRVLTEQGEVRPHVNVFVNGETVRREQVLRTSLDGDAEICIMPAVSGGSTIMKAIWNSTVLAESKATIVVEGNHYFPPDSVNREYLQASDTHTICPWKGEASYYHINVNAEVNEDAAWYYPDPKPAAQEIKDYVAFWHGVRIKE